MNNYEFKNFIQARALLLDSRSHPQKSTESNTTLNSSISSHHSEIAYILNSYFFSLVINIELLLTLATAVSIKASKTSVLSSQHLNQ